MFKKYLILGTGSNLPSSDYKYDALDHSAIPTCLWNLNFILCESKCGFMVRKEVGMYENNKV